LIARQGEVKLWHYSHTTDLFGDCDGLMEAIRGKIIEVVRKDIFSVSRIFWPVMKAGRCHLMR
jgi:hypothetical protein